MRSGWIFSERELDDLFEVHNGSIGEAGRQYNAHFFDDTRSWVDPNGYRLSDRIWEARQTTRGRIDDIIVGAIADGADAISTANRLEKYLNPSYAPIRNTKGKIIRDARRGIITNTPRDGAGSYPARRLMRTEITRAHGEATKATANALQYAVRWRLSGSHPKPDICDSNAQDNSDGLPDKTPPGVYWAIDVPQYPAHPQDLCYLAPYAIRPIDELVERLREKYGFEQDPNYVPYQGDTNSIISELKTRGIAKEVNIEQPELWSHDQMQRVAKSLEDNARRAPIQKAGGLNNVNIEQLDGAALARANNVAMYVDPVKTTDAMFGTYNGYESGRYVNAVAGQPTRWTVASTIPDVDQLEAVVTHEWGHVVSRSRNPFSQRAAEDAFHAEFSLLPPDQYATVIENLSEYGMTNNAEFFAESYVQYVYEPDTMNATLREWMRKFLSGSK